MSDFFKKPSFYFFNILLLVGFTLIFWPKNITALRQHQLEEITQNVEQQLSFLEDEAEIYIDATEKEQVSFQLSKFPAKNFFVIYKDDSLTYWNNYHIVPDQRLLRGFYDIRFVRLPGGQYICRRWEVGPYSIFGLIPLFEDPRLENQYVKPEYNKRIFPIDPVLVSEPGRDSEYEILYDSEPLFALTFPERSTANNTTYKEELGAYILLLAFLVFTYWIVRSRTYLESEYNNLSINSFIGLILISLRVIMLNVDFPRDYIQLSLFDPTAFASSDLNPTMGDLVLNLLVLLIIVVLFFKSRYSLIDRIKANKQRLFIAFVMILLYLTSIVLIYMIVQTIYHNSQITLDITQSLSFNELRIASYLVLMMVAVIIFLTGHVVLITVETLEIPNHKRIMLLLGGLVFFTIISLIENVHYFIPLGIGAFIIIITTLTRLYKNLLRIRFATYIYVFAWAIPTAVIIGYATHTLEKEKEYNNQIRYAERFLVENDVLAEFLLNEINDKIKEDVFIQSRLSSPFGGKEIIKDKVRQVYLSRYFDKYDVDILLFDSQGRPLDQNEMMLRPADIKRRNEKYKTEYLNIYFIDDPQEDVAGRYLDLIEIKKRGIRMGFILLDLRLKRLIPEDVYPELLVDSRFLQPFQNKPYSYAKYQNDEIIYSSGKFNYTVDFPVSILKQDKLYRTGTVESGYQHVAVKDSEDNIYVISVPAHSMDHIFSNFAFFFLLIIFVVLIISLVYAVSFLLRGSELYYSARIQLYLSLAFFIPMLTVTIVTLTLVNKSFKEEVKDEYESKAELLARNIADELVLSPYDNQLAPVLLRAAKYADTDANVFSGQGKLITSTQPMIFDKHLLADHINPAALMHIKLHDMQMVTLRERVGKLEFNTTYYGIKSSETGNLIGILGLPFFQSEATQELNTIDIFTNIINVFTIIFLLFLLISYLASEYLTFPLRIITKKLQKTSLEFNEPLSWEANDEIGLMVREYNRMVYNLEESKKALARSEKESAWREMAQQVAHEIKNPLTPMKLTLQHLQRTIASDNGNDQYQKSISTLLHQIDTLSDIASSFSAFAKMPSPTKNKFDIQKLLQRNISLFMNTEGVRLSYEDVAQQLMVEADEQMMGRIFSNLLINAIEAGKGYQDVEIAIKVEVIDDYDVLITVADNGPGIEESIQDKIFLPHFSTKKTGSGIGLAIAKRGIEHAGGKIWFETEGGKGTSFFIKLPLIDVR